MENSNFYRDGQYVDLENPLFPITVVTDRVAGLQKEFFFHYKLVMD